MRTASKSAAKMLLNRVLHRLLVVLKIDLLNQRDTLLNRMRTGF